MSKSPSELEVVFGVIKNYCKTLLGREAMSAASKQLHILEVCPGQSSQAVKTL